MKHGSEYVLREGRPIYISRRKGLSPWNGSGAFKLRNGADMVFLIIGVDVVELLLRNGAAVVFLFKKWSRSCGISYQDMEQLWYFLLRNGAAVVFLIKKWSSCGISY